MRKCRVSATYRNTVVSRTTIVVQAVVELNPIYVTLRYLLSCDKHAFVVYERCYSANIFGTLACAAQQHFADYRNNQPTVFLVWAGPTWFISGLDLFHK